MSESLLILLNKTTFTEYQYKKLYVDKRCCLVAVFNRILFYLFGSRGYFLGNAAGSVPIQTEQAAIHRYTTARSALLLEQNEKTMQAFNRAFNERKAQLVGVDGRLTATELDNWWKLDLKNEQLVKTLLQFSCQQKLQELVTLFAQNRDIEQEPLKSAITSYATALCACADKSAMGLLALYDKLNQDVSKVCHVNNRTLPKQAGQILKSSKFIYTSEIISLKWAIFQLLPVQENANWNDLFFQIYFQEYEDCIRHQEWDTAIENNSAHSLLLEGVSRFVDETENVYRQLGLYLKQIDEQAALDVRQLVELAASRIVHCIDKGVIEAAGKNLKQTGVKLGTLNESSSFLCAYAAFIGTKAEEGGNELFQHNRKVFISFVVRGLREKRYLKTLKELKALFSHNRDIEQQPLKSAVANYVAALRNHAEQNQLDLPLVYELVNKDIFRVYEKSGCDWSDGILLKWAIFQLLPVPEIPNWDDLFLSIYSSECEQLICGNKWDLFVNERALYPEIVRWISLFVLKTENIYRQLGVYLNSIDGQTPLDRKRFAELVACHIFDHIPKNAVAACHEKLDSELPEKEHRERQDFLLVHHSFTCKEDQWNQEEFRNHRATLIDRIAQDVSRALPS